MGDAWRNRYDSLVLFTPREFSRLPGMPFPGSRDQLPNKNEAADYLEAYADKYQLPIHLNTHVNNLSKSEGIYHISTNKGDYVAWEVIIATGPFQTDWKPEFASKLLTTINQIHSTNYKNPNQLLHGDTLVVGAGNSGAQIAVEISKQRQVYLAASRRPVSLPLQIFGKSIFYWFDKLGVLKTNVNSFIGRKIKARPDPVFGLEFKQRLKMNDIVLLPKAIDAHSNTIHFSDGSMREFTNIIWSTGFKSDYSWLKLPHVISEKGTIIHRRGITQESGLYVVGMPWQFRRTSSLMGGVGEDAKYVVNAIIQNLQGNTALFP